MGKGGERQRSKGVPIEGEQCEEGVGAEGIRGEVADGVETEVQDLGLKKKYHRINL